MGIFRTAGNFMGRSVAGAAIGATYAGSKSEWDAGAVQGGALAGALAGGVGGGIFKRTMNGLHLNPGRGLNYLGDRAIKGGFAGKFRQTLGRGLKHTGLATNRIAGAGLLTLGAGAAGHIGGTIMESNGGPRRARARNQ